MFFGDFLWTSNFSGPLTIFSHDTSQSLITMLGGSLKFSAKKLIFASIGYLHFSLALDMLVGVHLILLAVRCMREYVTKS